MATRKITELTEATAVEDTDLLVLVQDGETKKVQASKFVKDGDEVASAQTLGGYSPDDFVKKTETASDSDKLGGIDADQYVKKSDSGSSSTTTNPFWWTPIPYILPDTAYTTEGYIECDGRQLSVDGYAELYAVLGTHYNLSTDTDTTKFRIPDLRGRALIGHQVYKSQNDYDVIPTSTGQYVQNETYTSSAVISSETTKKAYDGQMLRLNVDNIPAHQHQTGTTVDTTEASGKAGQAFKYGSTDTLDDGVAVSTLNTMGTSTGEVNDQVAGFTGYNIYMNDVLKVSGANATPIPIVPPSLTVTWVMRTSKP